MAYNKGHKTSTTKGKCILCGVKTSTYLSIDNYINDGTMLSGVSIDIPVCDEHYPIIADKEEPLIAYAQNLNKFLGLYKYWVKED